MMRGMQLFATRGKVRVALDGYVIFTDDVRMWEYSHHLNNAAFNFNHLRMQNLL